MSASDSASMPVTKLFIGYAHRSVTSEKVKEAFENALNEADIVSKIDFREKTNDRGEQFFCYFVHFQRKNAQLQHMLKEIEKNGFVVLTYAREWDKKKWNNQAHSYGSYVDRYWKVLAYNEKPKAEAAEPAKFVPRLMSFSEVEAAGITAPKKSEPKKLVISAGLAEKIAAEQPLTNMEMVQVAMAKHTILPLTTEQLYASNLDWDSHDEKPLELPEIPPCPPVLRRSPSTAKEYGMPSRSKRRRSVDDVENAFSALALNEGSESEEEEIPAVDLE